MYRAKTIDGYTFLDQTDPYGKGYVVAPTEQGTDEAIFFDFQLVGKDRVFVCSLINSEVGGFIMRHDSKLLDLGMRFDAFTAHGSYWKALKEEVTSFVLGSCDWFGDNEISLSLPEVMQAASDFYDSIESSIKTWHNDNIEIDQSYVEIIADSPEEAIAGFLNNKNNRLALEECSDGLHLTCFPLGPNQWSVKLA